MATEGSAEPRVVVGVDGSAESIGALKWAASYAAATGATITAVLSWHYPTAAGPAPVGVAPQAISDEVRANMQEVLDKALTEVFGTTAPEKVHAKIRPFLRSLPGCSYRQSHSPPDFLPPARYRCSSSRTPELWG